MTDVQRFSTGREDRAPGGLASFRRGADDLPGSAASLPAWLGGSGASHRVAGEQSAYGAGDPFSQPSTLSRQELDDLVDAVVERIEQRVVDELERRGRHFTPGAF